MEKSGEVKHFNSSNRSDTDHYIQPKKRSRSESTERYSPPIEDEVLKQKILDTLDRIERKLDIISKSLEENRETNGVNSVCLKPEETADEKPYKMKSKERKRKNDKKREEATDEKPYKKKSKERKRKNDPLKTSIRD